VLFWRWFHLGCIAAGLNQKITSPFCWDWQAFHETIGRLWRARAPLKLLAGTAIICRMVFAAAGVSVVCTLALELLRQGRLWDKRAFRTLLARLGRLDANEAGRRTGRLVQNSGPNWVQKMLQHWDGARWKAACGCVAKFFSAPAAAGGRTDVHDICKSLSNECALPGVGRYGIVSLVRNCSASRLELDGVVIGPCEAAWQKFIRTMNKATVTRMFDHLGVHTLPEAHAMQRTLVGIAKSAFSSRWVAMWSKMSVPDLTVQTCEGTSILGVVGQSGKMPPRQRGDSRKVAEWVLKRLPASIKGIREMSKRMRIGPAMRRQGTGDKDPEAAAVVAKAWVDSDPPELPKSLWHAMRGECRMPWKLPRLMCKECYQQLGADATVRANLCTVCRFDAVRERDRKRQAKRRRLQ